MTPGVLVIGDVMRDVIVRPEGALCPGADRTAAIRILPGGSGANAAAWLARFGVPTKFGGRVGRGDVEGQSALLRSSGVVPHLAADPEAPTGTVVTILAPDGERSFFTDRGANARLCRADLPDALLEGVGLVHVSGYALFAPGPRAAVLDFLGEARRRGIGVSVDAASHSFLEEVGGATFLAWTDGAEILFANEAEAAVLAGTADRGGQLDRLSQRYGIVVIKRGASGAEAAWGEKRWSVPAPEVAVADTSGAGDAFLAGFLSAHLAGASIDVCLHRGVEAGSRAAARFGGRPD